MTPPKSVSFTGQECKIIYTRDSVRRGSLLLSPTLAYDKVLHQVEIKICLLDVDEPDPNSPSFDTAIGKTFVYKVAYQPDDLPRYLKEPVLEVNPKDQHLQVKSRTRVYDN